MATSPPAHAMPLNNPKKRSSTSSGINLSTAQPSTSTKRPKHSHPLRQTSFSHAGSAPASEAGSTTSKPAGKRNRGRPRKHASQADLSPPLPNTTNHATPNAASSLNAPGGGATTAPRSVATDHPSPPSDDELDIDLPDQLPLSTDVDLASERAQLAVLQDALSPAQNSRYAAYKNTKIKSSTLKRIVNQVVSQSVTAIPLSSVQWVAKVFLGEVVEGARVVQEEWAREWEEDMADKKRKWEFMIDNAEDDEDQEEEDEHENEESVDEGEKEDKKEEKRGNLDPEAKKHANWLAELTRRREKIAVEANTHAQDVARLGPIAAATAAAARAKREPEIDPNTPASNTFPHQQQYYGDGNPHRGGLLPQHLREAVRRAKVAGEYGGLGSGGRSHGGLGSQGEATGRVGLGMGAGVGSGGGGRFFR